MAPWHGFAETNFGVGLRLVAQLQLDVPVCKGGPDLIPWIVTIYLALLRDAAPGMCTPK